MSTEVWNLSAGSAPARKAVVAGDSLPDTVSGQPASYFWKDVIQTGHYTKADHTLSLDVDLSRLQRWLDTGREMLAAGLRIPINCDHSPSARDVVGYVKDFKLEESRLMALCQLIGPDAAALAARNQVSLGISPEFIDGTSRAWGEAIVHLALTPNPVVPDQGEFVRAAAPLMLANPARQTAVELLQMKLDTAVQRGGLSPACRDRLLALLSAADQPDLLLLSANAAQRPLALAFAEALIDNHLAPQGESTGLQMLQRGVPGTEDQPLGDLGKYMTGIANR